jgi:wnt family
VPSSRTNGNDSRLPQYPTTECRYADALTRQQKALLCQHHQQLVDAIRQAALSTLDECRYQFRNERWNCPIAVQRVEDRRLLQKVPKEGNKRYNCHNLKKLMFTHKKQVLGADCNRDGWRITGYTETHS